MISLETTVWTAGLIALGAVAALVLARFYSLRNQRLMRCPETGSLAIVEAVCVACPGETRSAVTVRSCDLWPQGQCCARGCLKRYAETEPGYRIHVGALRPFAAADKGGAAQ